MKFDLFYELSVPAFAGRNERTVFHDTISEIELADGLGFHGVWLVEHHFMPEYSHSTAPELFLAALSQRTRRLRLGHAVVPLPYHHPIQVAERLATLDVLSDGRLEFGFGRGFSPSEYQVFGADMAAGRSLTEEALGIIRQSFGGGPIRHQGPHFRFEGLHVLPGIVQQPHPPIWTAAVSPDSFEMAARLGIGVLAGPFKPWLMVREDLRRYRRHWQRYQGDQPSPPGVNGRSAMTIGIFCLEDAGEARRIARPAFDWFYQHLLGQTRPVLEKLYDGYEYYRRVGRFRGLLQGAVNLGLLETLGMAIVGDPEHCRKSLGKLAKAGVDHVLCAVGAGVLPTQQVRHCMQLLSDEVIPHFDASARD
jgi:alkanesulfonate monooxygenase SsuD/methylene tetrahydromethanopterin reductase-like flavin-dependent oxidoreductase (luciferase family)